MLAALLPLSHGSRLFAAQNAFINQSTQLSGIVVDHVPKPATASKRSGNEVYAVVQFTEVSGAQRQAKANVASYPPTHNIGDTIEVRIHNSVPDDVRIASFTGLWFESAFYLIPGLLTLMAGAFLFFKRKP